MQAMIIVRVRFDEDAWEDVVNPTLDRVLGFGRSTDSLRALIRRGKYGMDSLHQYLTSCVSDLNIDAAMFEGKVERLIEVMEQLYAFYLPC